jgi:hypothetical protein
MKKKLVTLSGCAARSPIFARGRAGRRGALVLGRMEGRAACPRPSQRTRLLTCRMSDADCFNCNAGRKKFST